jgi:hypothetical protein
MLLQEHYGIHDQLLTCSTRADKIKKNFMSSTFKTLLSKAMRKLKGKMSETFKFIASLFFLPIRSYQRHTNTIRRKIRVIVGQMEFEAGNGTRLSSEVFLERYRKRQKIVAGCCDVESDD